MRKKQSLSDQSIIHSWKKLIVQGHWERIKKEQVGVVIEKPDNLTIVTCHNYPEPSLFEQSLEFFGIRDYVILNELFEGPWHNSLKLEWMLKYLKSGKCKTEYLLFCDARDSVICGDLHQVIHFFNLLPDCDLFFNSTMAHYGIYFSNRDVWLQTRVVTRKKGRYLNSGVYIGRPDYIKEIFEKAVTLLKAAVPVSFSIDGNENYIYQDQDILRFMYPVLFPRIDIDYWNDVFYRN